MSFILTWKPKSDGPDTCVGFYWGVTRAEVLAMARGLRLEGYANVHVLKENKSISEVEQ